jgi:bacteriocin-like protein
MDADATKPIEQKIPIEAGETLELSEEDLAQVNGGVDNVKDPPAPKKDITFGVQKDKMQSANKNAEAVKGLL